MRIMTTQTPISSLELWLKPCCCCACCCCCCNGFSDSPFSAVDSELGIASFSISLDITPKRPLVALRNNFPYDAYDDYDAGTVKGATERSYCLQLSSAFISLCCRWWWPFYFSNLLVKPIFFFLVLFPSFFKIHQKCIITQLEILSNTTDLMYSNAIRKNLRRINNPLSWLISKGYW